MKSTAALCRRLLSKGEPSSRIPTMAVELGIWQGEYLNQNLPWLRWWDSSGNLLLSGDERADREQQRADRLAAKLRELGIDPDA
jgi:hypothetical protein